MPLDQEHDRIWRAIEGHEMPEGFASDLMREHKLKRETAERAIFEYKRFIYLVATAQGARRVPSKAVDLVWHAHMMHSRDYWDVFCAAIGTPIHHTPGGKGAAHLADYQATQRAYRDAFDEAPAKGIWRKSGRFGLLMTAAVGAVFTYLGIAEVIEGSPWGILIAGVGVFSLSMGLLGQTSRGQFYLTFEARGPFADNNAGDCGDGGGCGGD